MISVAFLLILIVAVAGSGLLTGWMVWMMSRTRKLEARPQTEEGGLPWDRLEELAGELADVRRQLALLEERTEFSERLLEDRSSATDSPPTASPE
ncbi:MAG: hypothetical protein ACE5FP_02860 [Gemmatimonadota bacterium]